MLLGFPHIYGWTFCDFPRVLHDILKLIVFHPVISLRDILLMWVLFSISLFVEAQEDFNFICWKFTMEIKFKINTRFSR